MDTTIPVRSVPVVIIQTSAPAFDACAEELAISGFKVGEDYVLGRYPDIIEQHITHDQKQFLITGTFGGDQDAADEFVRRMKARNKQLQAAMFSALDVTAGEPYDMLIQKGRAGKFCSHLIREMKVFLAGQ